MSLLELSPHASDDGRSMHACNAFRALTAVLNHSAVVPSPLLAIDGRGHTRKRADALLHVLKDTHHREHKSIMRHMSMLETFRIRMFDLRSDNGNVMLMTNAHTKEHWICLYMKLCIVLITLPHPFHSHPVQHVRAQPLRLQRSRHIPHAQHFRAQPLRLERLHHLPQHHRDHHLRSPPRHRW